MSDIRRSQLAAWAADRLHIREVALAPASADASFRRYFRLQGPESSVIAMDAPPPEDVRIFSNVAARLELAGVRVPAILAEDAERGFALLEDLGTKTWLDVLTRDNADDLFGKAIGVLIRMQSRTDTSQLPEYDQPLLRRELRVFTEWYLSRHLGRPPDAPDRRALAPVFEQLEAAALTQPRVFVHRDFMARNLMGPGAEPAVIDFQDAVLGPVTYDPLCLFKDAFISWPEDRIQGWLEQYWRDARRAGIPLPADRGAFQRALDWMGIQRHLKVIGIFARLHYRDGKSGYLEDIPRFFTYLRDVARRYPELAALQDLLEEWEPSPAAGARAQ